MIRRSSSSEINLASYSEILPTQIEKFLQDFEYGDVENKIKDILPTEIREIIAEAKDNRSQIWLLFWYLCSVESNIPTFLELISYEYKWLVDGLKQERNSPLSDAQCYIKEVKILRSSNPKHTKYNVRRIVLFERLYDALKKVKPHKPVVLFGALGSGKKWLTLDVCQEYTIMKAMDFKIYWLNVSQCTSIEKDIEMLEQLSIQLGDPMLEQRSSMSFENRKSHLQTNLEQKFKNSEKFQNCLLVLKNVQNGKTWKTFNLGCKTLLTTRNKNTSDSLSHIGRLLSIEEGFSRLEFIGLLEKYFERNLEKYKLKADEIYKYSDANPCLLNIIAPDLSLDASAWDRWIDKLSQPEYTKKVKYFSLKSKFKTIITTSLKALLPDQLELYYTFKVFPYHAPIPANLLTALWNMESNGILQKFNAISILTLMPSDERDGSLVYVLPFVYSFYLKEYKYDKSKADVIPLHNRVISYYRVEELFSARTELHLCNNQHDSYFYNYIGHHLIEAGRTDLLSRLYLDFGFLEQKIRTVGLLNTIGDLKSYRKEIENLDSRRYELLLDLIEFLPKVEVKLVQSKDTCLLQYALWESGPTKEEAVRQVKQYADRIWFTEKGNFHQPRQIIKLPKQPTSVTIIEPDICLVVLSKSVLLLDISLDYNNGPTFLIRHNERNGRIVQVRLFHNKSYLLTLDEYGALKLWSIDSEMRRSVVQRRSSKHKVTALDFKQPSDSRAEKCKQAIHEIHNKGSRIVAFNVEELPSREETRLHVASENGHIRVFEWNKMNKVFELLKAPTLVTEQKDIRFFSKILDRYYMLLNTGNHLKFWDLRDSNEAMSFFDWKNNPDQKSSLIGFEVFTNRNSDGSTSTFIIFIFSKIVRRLTFKPIAVANLCGKVEDIYETEDVITCAKLSRDGLYLVLGTKHGLIIFDMATQSRVLHRNVSEAISCVDICDLTDLYFKYLIICGTEHKTTLNIYALSTETDGFVSWADNISYKSNEDSNNPQLEPWVWLQGQKLFDVSYYNNSTTLIAADCKNRVCTTKKKNWSIIMPDGISSTITAVTICKNEIFVGYQDGNIFNVTKDITENICPANPIYAVSYLQLMDEHILVAAGESGAHYTTCIRDSSHSLNINIEFQTRKCYKVFDHYLLLINYYGRVVILDCNLNYKPVYPRDDAKYIDIRHDYLCGCDFKDSRLFTATIRGNIFIYSLLADNDGTLNVAGPSACSTNEVPNRHVSCLAVATDGTLLATGYANGDIEVYRLLGESLIIFLHKLESHTCQIYDLLFSPCANVLASCSEQLCFWSVPYMLNNSLKKNSPKRRSSRFSSQRCSDSEDADSLVVSSRSNLLQIRESDVHGGISNDLNKSTQATTAKYWEGKRGPADKPELLACLKFDGNKAELIFANDQFTQFNTIDDEGVYYHLNIWNVAKAAPSPCSQIVFPTPAITRKTALDDAEDNKVGHDVFM